MGRGLPPELQSAPNAGGAMWRHLFDRAYLSLFREYPQLAALALVTLCAQLAVGLVNFYALPLFLFSVHHLSGQQVGLVASTFLISETLFKIPLGWVSDRVGRRPLIALGTLCTCLNPTVIVSLPRTLWVAVFPIRVVDGAGVAALWPPLYAAVGDLTRGRSRAAAMSVINTVYLIGTGLAAAVGGFATALTGSAHVPFYLASVLLLLASVVSYLGLRPSHQRAEPRDEEEEPSGEVPEAAEPQAPTVGSGYSFPLILTLSFLMMLGPLTVATYLVPYLKTDLGLSDGGLGGLLLAMGVPVLFLGLPLGRVADRWGTSRAVRFSLLVAAGLVWVLPVPGHPLVFGLVAVATILLLMFGAPAWLALVSGLARARTRGGIMGTVATAEGLGAAIGPWIGGLLWDTGHAHIFYGAAGALTLAAVVALIALRKGQ